MVHPTLFQEGKWSDAREGVSALNRLEIVVEVEEERLSVARLDKAIGMAIEVLLQRLVFHEMKDILLENLCLKMRDRPRF